ncbi:MAG TPA: hypothetical protein PKU78_06715 [Candidatus Dojkabacteria bacterium]|nr:hypothetical protein [Candidatus Dojkabacteria bacterium]
MPKEPIRTFDDFWCSNCPYLKDISDPENTLRGKCSLVNVELEWYDYWIAECLNEGLTDLPEIINTEPISRHSK